MAPITLTRGDNNTHIQDGGDVLISQIHMQFFN